VLNLVWSVLFAALAFVRTRRRLAIGLLALRLRIRYTPDLMVPEVLEEIPALHSYSECFGSNSGGWYYDDPEHPTRIEVCPCTCTRFRTGFVDVQYGCVPKGL
jgi:hypothetical protein